MKKIKKTLKEKKSILWIIVFTLLLLFIGAPLFNAIATNKWSFHFINENNYDAWIGYYGSILGGALTLGGVWWTIKDQEMQRIKNLSIQYRPLLKESYYEKKELNIGENYRGLLWIVDNRIKKYWLRDRKKHHNAYQRLQKYDKFKSYTFKSCNHRERAAQRVGHEYNTCI